MKAINKFIVITPISSEALKKSGMLLPESLEKDIRYLKAKVTSIGDEVTKVTDGDIIYYDKFAGHFMDYEGTSYKVIKEENIVILL